MQPEVGRFLEGHLHEVLQMILVLHDYSVGQGVDVHAWVDGRELVFGTQARTGSGFLRVLPHDVTVTVAFPRGHDIADPLKRAKGPRGSRTRLTLRTTGDVDSYLRRMIDAAYALDQE